MIKVRWMIAIVLLFCLPAFLEAGQFRVRINGSWKIKLDDANLTGAAGTGFTTPYESGASDFTFTIQNSSTTWSCYIRKVDTTWSPNLSIYARRTGPGSGGTVSGGTTYLNITNSDTLFFTGSGVPSNVPIQLALDLILQYLNATTYECTLVYTVTED